MQFGLAGRTFELSCSVFLHALCVAFAYRRLLAQLGEFELHQNRSRLSLHGLGCLTNIPCSRWMHFAAKSAHIGPLLL